MTTNLTKEQYEKLTPWKKDILAAYKNSFIHVSGPDFLKIAALYKEIMREELTQRQMGCNTCRLNALRKLGELYANYKPKKEEEEEKEEEPKPKRPGRPKKLD